MEKVNPIGVFDSGYGGLTVLKEIVQKLPHNDFIYLGDNARAPYGNRSFETVYHYTLQAVQWLFAQGCPLVILACNTASAKALRSIQQHDLPKMGSDKRVLGVIRPTTEVIGNYSSNGSVGILATQGTINSGSYIMEIEKFFPGIKVRQEACPMWVPLVENNEHNSHGADFFIKKHIHHIFEKGKDIDVLLLACTHYPILKEKIAEYAPVGVKLVSQGELVANSLYDYLQRHPEMDARCSRNGELKFFTTDDSKDFDQHGSLFFGAMVSSKQVEINNNKQ